MIFPINKKHTFFSKEKTLLTFFFILFISFSAFGQQDKKLILLQTSDVHSRLEPINQEGDRNYDKGGFVRRATFVKEFRKEHPDMLCSIAEIFRRGHLIIICSRVKSK